MNSDVLRKLRVDLGYKQTHLAELLNVTQSTVSRLEKGELAISPRLASALLELPRQSDNLYFKLRPANWARSIRRFRKLRGITQEQFAYMAGSTDVTVRRWELGLSQPSITAQKRLRHIILRPIETCREADVFFNQYRNADVMKSICAGSILLDINDCAKRKFPNHSGGLIGSEWTSRAPDCAELYDSYVANDLFHKDAVSFHRCIYMPTFDEHYSVTVEKMTFTPDTTVEFNERAVTTREMCKANTDVTVVFADELISV